MRAVVSFSIVALCGCSATHSESITTECKKSSCEDVSVDVAVDVFRREYDFDVDQRLHVVIVNPETINGLHGLASEECNLIFTADSKTLLHELLHVRFCRDSDDADPTHEIPPGPWRFHDTLMLEALENLLPPAEKN